MAYCSQTANRSARFEALSVYAETPAGQTTMLMRDLPQPLTLLTIVLKYLVRATSPIAWGPMTILPAVSYRVIPAHPSTRP
jgi:hypothetical protein